METGISLHFIRAIYFIVKRTRMQQMPCNAVCVCASSSSSSVNSNTDLNMKICNRMLKNMQKFYCVQTTVVVLWGKMHPNEQNEWQRYSISVTLSLLHASQLKIVFGDTDCTCIVRHCFCIWSEQATINIMGYKKECACASSRQIDMYGIWSFRFNF